MELRYNLHTEFRRLIFTLEQIKSGFYYENDFVILPHLTDYRKLVILPQFPLNEIFNLKEKIPNKRIYTASKWELNKSKFTQEDKKLLEEYLEKDLLKQNQIRKLQKNLELKITEAKEITDQLIKIDTKNIIIVPTKMGTEASTFLHKEKIIIYWRIDTGFSKPFAMIIANALSRTSLYNTKNRIDWVSKMKIVESIMINTNLQKIFPDFTPMLDNKYNDKKLSQLKLESEEFLSKFNLNHKTQVKLKNNKVFLQRKELNETDYYPQSIKLLKLFIEKTNEVLTFEEIAKLLWEKDSYQKFSLQAIAKQIQFIREILTDYQIPSENLQSVSKRGYILKVTD